MPQQVQMTCFVTLARLDMERTMAARHQRSSPSNIYHIVTTAPGRQDPLPASLLRALLGTCI
jgi:hypothetical protein